MSNKLLIFAGPGEAFDVDAVDRALTILPDWRVDRLGPGIGACQQYDCMRGPDRLTVRLSPDRETVAIDGHPGLPSAILALALRAACSRPLRITDMGYNFDLELDRYSSPEELLAAL